jgi:AcrR family transcriptional regulator
MARPRKVLADHELATRPSPGQARGIRQKAVADLRRALVLAAARQTFLELGLEGASLREIAKRAGYSPGAIYSYFESKEEVYGALLDESLERLNEAVANGGNEAAHGRQDTPHWDGYVRAKARAFFEFYRDNPRDLDLGFYLFHGMQPRGLTPGLNEALNARLLAALSPTHEGLVRLGLNTKEAQREMTALLAQIVGLLLLNHTGRIRMFREDASALLEHYLDGLLHRINARSVAGR